MADLTDQQAAQSVKVTGAGSSGAETNYLDVDSNGKLYVRLSDGGGTALTSQVNGTQRALDVGINVAGVQVDPRAIRALTSADVVSAAQSGTWNITNISGTISLPTGAATSALQTTGNASLSSIDTKITTTANGIKVDGSAVTQPISAASLPLPTGAATAANQATEITSLQLIDDLPHAQNAALNKGVPVMGQLDDTSTTAATEDAVAVARITAQRALHTNLRNNAGTELATAAAPLRTDPTGTTTQPISAAALPLPTGAATSALQTAGNASLASIDSKVPTIGQKAMSGSLPVVLPSDQTIQASIAAESHSSFSPDFSNYDTNSTAPLNVDAAGNLMVRGQVLSDEGSLRDDFVGSSLSTALTGTLSFTSGGLAVTGTGTSFTTQLQAGDYVKANAHAESAWAQVDSVDSDTQLTLISGYVGATVAGAASSESNWRTVTGSGATISVASGLLSVASGITSGASTSVYRAGDYLPYNLIAKLAITQRIANQTTILGFVDAITGATKKAMFQFDGTTNTTVKCISSFSASATETQTTTVTLPGGVNTSAQNRYEIDLTGNKCTFLINDVIVAQHQDHLPGPYDNLLIGVQIANAAVVTTTTVAVDWLYFSNVDQVEVSANFPGEPQRVQITGKSQTTGLSTDMIIAASGDVLVKDIVNSSAFGAISVSTSAVLAKAGASALANRKCIVITPYNGQVFWGTSAAVTIATGQPIFKYQTVALAVSENVTIYLIAASGTVDVRVMEGGS